MNRRNFLKLAGKGAIAAAFAAVVGLPEVTEKPKNLCGKATKVKGSVDISEVSYTYAAYIKDDGLYWGTVPISQELLDDAVVDLRPIIASRIEDGLRREQAEWERSVLFGDVDQKPIGVLQHNKKFSCEAKWDGIEWTAANEQA